MRRSSRRVEKPSTARWIVERIVPWLDLAVVAASLAAVSLVPVFFLVPFNDEWLRMNYLADHSVWEWTVMHAETWVVRPTGEVILGLISATLTRPALAHDFTPPTFLARFHAGYVALAVASWALLYANAAILARSVRALGLATLMLFGLLASWAMSTELGAAFYWADGYANVMLPLTLFTGGLPLLLRERPWPGAIGALLILLGALGHEAVTIYALGCIGLAIAFRRPALQVWHWRAAWAALWLVCLAILFWQLFGDGPMVRNDQYFRNTGTRYSLAGAWLNIREISPLRAALCVLGSTLAIASYRDRLGSVPERARADVERHRWFWILLAAGTLMTCFLPLGSVGLKKGQLAVSYYSVFTHLVFVLLGALLYPLLAGWLDRALDGYRRVLGSVLPVLLVVALASPNLADFREAVTRHRGLRNEAEAYLHALFHAGKRVNVCRPRHPFSKPDRSMTARNQETYFEIARVLNRCPKR